LLESSNGISRGETNPVLVFWGDSGFCEYADVDRNKQAMNRKFEILYISLKRQFCCYTRHVKLIDKIYFCVIV
jgi:hypothetical protein